MTRGCRRIAGAACLAMALLICACAPPRPAEPPPAAATTPAAAPDATLPADPSLYELELSLTDQRGTAIRFDAHRGSPVLLAMFYATCPSACPRLMEEVKALEARLPEATRARTRILLVSMDPERDTPEVLAEAAVRHAVDQSRWTLARAPEEGVRELAAILGVRYRMQQDGSIDHSSAVFLLDARGVIVERTEGLGRPTDAIERRLSSM